MTDPNPTRLAGSPSMGEPALGLAPVNVVERSPTGLAMVPQIVVRIALVIGAIATVGIAVFTPFLPQPWAITGLGISASLAGLAGVITGAGPGVRTQAGTQPVTLAQPAAPPSAPRLGPPPG